MMNGIFVSQENGYKYVHVLNNRDFAIFVFEGT